MVRFVIGVSALALCGPAFSQTAPPPALVARPAQTDSVVLPANTEVTVSTNEELTTKKNAEGDPVYFTVTHDVILKGYVVIPRGSRAVGEITWMTGKGMFGKSGKLEFELRYAEVGNMRVPLTGKFRQEGSGNTVATVGAVVLVPVAGFFVTGKSGSVPRGRELTVYTSQDVPVILPATLPPPQAIVAQPAGHP